MQTFLKLNPKDNVIVALQDFPQGSSLTIDGHLLTLLEPVARGHKIALHPLQEGEDIIKYGYPIGHAIKAIETGAWVHTHNCKTNLDGELEYTYQPQSNVRTFPLEHRTFNGYRRKDGRVGIRNDLFIVPTVGCVNGIAQIIIRKYQKAFPNDDVFTNLTVLAHPFGCSQLGDDHANTRTMLIDATKHPNAGGVLVLGLGCENNIVSTFKELLGDYDQTRIKFLVSQEVDDEIEAGYQCLLELRQAALNDRREPIPLSELKVGLKCGGSDGLSGITANPLLGIFSDYLVAQGGSTVLTEVPEMFGAETMLMARAENETIFHHIVDLINNFKHYFASYGEPVYENPSPGNKAGGITTLEDKSLGCTQKAGTSLVRDVLLYGETIRKPGLSLLQAPGNDLVASSALAASGCQMVLFTTGRGTPFGCFVPTIKVATNTPLFEKKTAWMDFNAGILLDQTLEEVVVKFTDYLIDIASGTPTKNEENEIREIAIFKNGVTL